MQKKTVKNTVAKKPVAKKNSAKKTVAKSSSVKKPVAKKVVKTVAKPVAPVVKTVPAQKMVSFGRAFVNFFKGYVDFFGTAQRSEYWWMFLALFAPMMILTIATLVIFAHIPMANTLPAEVLVAASPVALWWCWTVYAVFGLVCIIPMWALMARRLHDIGMTAHLLWINLIIMVLEAVLPFSILLSAISWTWTAVMWMFMMLPSKLKNNRYR